jgi:hypothetical protein
MTTFLRGLPVDHATCHATPAPTTPVVRCPLLSLIDQEMLPHRLALPYCLRKRDIAATMTPIGVWRHPLPEKETTWIERHPSSKV